MCVIFSFIGFNVYASGNAIEVVIPVSQKFYIQGGSTGEHTHIGNYELCSKETESPMPEGSENSRFVFSIYGNNTSNEIKLLYNRAGAYHYTLKQITEDSKKYRYDRTIYTITVYIQNTPDGKLSSQVVVENDEDGKCAEICFENNYINDSNPTPSPETGDKTNLVFWKLVCLSSLGVLIVLFVIRKKQTFGYSAK